MGAFNEFVTRADALADETFTEYTVTKRRLEAAERKKAETPVKSGLVSAEYAVRAARAEADFLTAKEKFEAVKRGLPEKSREMAAIRADFVAAVDSHFAADPAKLDKATLALLDSGILRPSEFERLMANAEKDENFHDDALNRCQSCRSGRQGTDARGRSHFEGCCHAWAQRGW